MWRIVALGADQDMGMSCGRPGGSAFAGLVEHHIAFAHGFHHFEHAGEAGRNDARFARAEVGGLTVGVDQPQAAGQNVEEFVPVGVEGDAPGARFALPLADGQCFLFAAVGFPGGALRRDAE